MSTKREGKAGGKADALISILLDELQALIRAINGDTRAEEIVARQMCEVVIKELLKESNDEAN